jgi:hypothetical protein
MQALSCLRGSRNSRLAVAGRVLQNIRFSEARATVQFHQRNCFLKLTLEIWILRT